MTPQFLLIDADDTLWENNIYFERAFDEFVAFLDHSAMSPGEVRAVLDEIEEVNARIHGYGSINFGRNLRQCYERLSERALRDQALHDQALHDQDLRRVISFAERILECPMETLAGVPETLAYLCERHDLTLFTKGNPEEQKLKIDRSQLGPFFRHTAIVKEKDTTAYLRLIEEWQLDPARTWMVGNSPKSDINPAMEAGLNAAFIPHPHTWVLEKQEIRPGAGKLLVLEEFAELRKHF